MAVARGEYSGNWDPEPGGWRRMSNILLNEKAVGVDVTPVKLGTGKLDKSFNVLHLTGTTKMTFDEAQRKEIKDFVNGGGLVVVDAAGGNGDFASSIEREMSLLWPDATRQFDKPLPPDHALYKAAGKLPDVVLTPPPKGAATKPTTTSAEPLEVRYRDFFRRSVAGRTDAPLLRGLEVDGRLAVLYSREDISTGLVGMPIEGILGYSPESATEIMENILIYALQKGK
jgi:hypothetical protein